MMTRDKIKSQVSKSGEKIDQDLSNRRKVVRNILAYGGVAAGSVTASKWVKPVVDTVTLPAHAQTSVLNARLGGNVGGRTTSTEFDRGPGILNFFVDSAIAGVATTPSVILEGGCLTITISGSTISFEIVLLMGMPIMGAGTISGTTLTGVGGGVILLGTTNSAGSPTSATGTVAIGGVTFGYMINSSGAGSCTAMLPSTTTTTTTTTTTIPPG